MLIDQLEIKSFRSVKDLKINLKQKNILIGNNAAGKTSILESIYYLAYTKSFKSNFKSVLNFDSEFIKLVASTNKGVFKLIETEKSLKLSLNNLEYQKKTDYIGNLLVVLFNPSDLELVKSEPAFKRKWLNMTLGAITNSYLVNLNIYNQLLKQRNTILKNNYDELMIDIISGQMSYYNDLIVKERLEFIDEINKLLKEASLKLSNDQDLVSITYHYQTNLYEKLKAKLEQDKILKTTSLGAHRDNLVFKINNKEASLYASQGQIRTILLALTLSIIKYYQVVSGEYPILLLDDVFSELDESRINSLFSSINSELQVIMTTTDLKNIEKYNLENVEIFTIKNGELVKEEL